MYNTPVAKIPPAKDLPTKLTGGRQFKPAEVAKALVEHHGIASAAARALGCSRDTVHEHIKKHPVVAAAASTARETVIDAAESKLIKAMANDEKWAILEVLHGPGRDRGYGEPTRAPEGEGLAANIITQIFLSIKGAEARGIIPPPSQPMIQVQP